MKHILIVMIGVAGIGKSYLAKHILDTHEDCTIVSRDAIRFAKLQDDDDYFKYEDEVEANYYNAISAAIQTHEYVIADATHITKKSRRKLFSNISLIDISPVESPDSYKLIVCILIFPILPAPE